MCVCVCFETLVIRYFVQIIFGCLVCQITGSGILCIYFHRHFCDLSSAESKVTLIERGSLALSEQRIIPSQSSSWISLDSESSTQQCSKQERADIQEGLRCL